MILQKGVRVRHLTRGSTYTVEGTLTVQHSDGDRSLDGEVLIVYADETTKRCWLAASFGV